MFQSDGLSAHLPPGSAGGWDEGAAPCSHLDVGVTWGLERVLHVWRVISAPSKTRDGDYKVTFSKSESRLVTNPWSAFSVPFRSCPQWSDPAPTHWGQEAGGRGKQRGIVRGRVCAPPSTGSVSGRSFGMIHTESVLLMDAGSFHYKGSACEPQFNFSRTELRTEGSRGKGSPMSFGWR